MRDPARIDRVLDRLREYWKAHPDMRLGQIVANASRPGEGPVDVWNMEEDRFLEGLAWLEESERPLGAGWCKE